VCQSQSDNRDTAASNQIRPIGATESMLFISKHSQIKSLQQCRVLIYIIELPRRYRGGPLPFNKSGIELQAFTVRNISASKVTTGGEIPSHTWHRKSFYWNRSRQSGISPCDVPQSAPRKAPSGMQISWYVLCLGRHFGVLGDA